MLAGLAVGNGAGQARPPIAAECHVEGARWTPAMPITVERFGDETSQTVLVFLHGTAGPDTYREWAERLASYHLLVLMPHYFEATKSRTPNDHNYADWAQAVLHSIEVQKTRLSPGQTVAVLGYSLGASVGLAMTTQCPVASHVVSWSGSLPDFFFNHLRSVPHLLILHGQDDANIPVINATQLAKLCTLAKVSCELNIYKGEGHFFQAANTRKAEQQVLQFLGNNSDLKETEQH